MTVPAGGVVTAETCLFVGARVGGPYVRFGLLVHLCTLLALVSAPLVVSSHGPYFAFVPLPVLRLVGLSIPPIAPELLRLAVIYVALLPPVVFAVRSEARWLFSVRRELAALRRSLAGRELLGPLAIVALGAGIARLEVAVNPPPTVIPTPSPGWILAAVLVLFVLVAGVEELLFRGVLQSAFVIRFGERRGILAAAALFGAMHGFYGSLSLVALAFGVGVGFGYLFARSGSLLLTVLAHGSTNLFLFLVFA